MPQGIKELSDFRAVGINDAGIEMTPATVSAHLQFTADLMQRWRFVHLPHMESGQCSSYQGWSSLLDDAAILRRDFPDYRPAQSLYARAVEHGVVSLQEWAGRYRTMHAEALQSMIRQWFPDLIMQLGPEACGFGGPLCSREETQHLLDGLTAAAVTLQSTCMLSQVANLRYPGDNWAVSAYILRYRCWSDEEEAQEFAAQPQCAENSSA